MTLKFSGDPFVKEPAREPLYVCLQGRDDDANQYVECQVPATTLIKQFGARGITNQELIRAFQAHRTRVEMTAVKQYESNNYEKQTDPIVIWLGEDSF